MTDAAELVKLADELPTRLRGLVEDGQSVAVSDALEEAADEIERLRAALAAQQDGAREALAAAWMYCHCAARGFTFAETDIPGCKGSWLWHRALEAADKMRPEQGSRSNEG